MCKSVVGKKKEADIMMETVRDIVTVMAYVTVLGLVGCLVSVGLAGCAGGSGVDFLML